MPEPSAISLSLCEHFAGLEDPRKVDPFVKTVEEAILMWVDLLFHAVSLDPVH